MKPLLIYPLCVPIPAGRAAGDAYALLLIDDFVYEWQHGVRRYRLRLPRGFVFDGASVPRVLWTLTGITPFGLELMAALVHDLGYSLNGDVPGEIQQRWDNDAGEWRPCGAKWTRREIDRLFVRILRECGISRRRRRMMYLGVRAGGWVPWYFRQVRELVSAATVERYLALYPARLLECPVLTAE